LLGRLTRLRVTYHAGQRLPLTQAPKHCPGGMRMQTLELKGTLSAADAAALAAWPMPWLRRLLLTRMDPAILRALLRAPWAAELKELSLDGPCLGTAEGATRPGARGYLPGLALWA
jgi:hypothetical protein